MATLVLLAIRLEGQADINLIFDLIESNKVETIIVKDTSRLGRDYLKVGFYTEVLFVEKKYPIYCYQQRY